MRAHAEPVISLRPGAHGYHPPRVSGAAGAHVISTRRGLRGERRRSDHRGRIHGPPNAGATLVGWAAPGGGSKRKCENRARKSDAGDDYIPELFSDVQET